MSKRLKTLRLTPDQWETLERHLGETIVELLQDGDWCSLAHLSDLLGVWSKLAFKGGKSK